MIDPQRLIAVARSLVAGSNPSPTEEALRRAVSSAYYAIFHAVLREAAERFVGQNNQSVAFEIMYRGFDHKNVKQTLEAVDKQTLSCAYQRRLRRSSVSQEVRDFAAIFVPMQEFRHSVDYNPLMSLSQSEASDRIDEAENALQILSTIDPEEKADLFAIMLIGFRG